MIHVAVRTRRKRREASVAIDPKLDAGAMIRRHWAAIRRYLRVLGADAALADDLAQDVFVLAMKKGIEDRGAPTAVWLRRAARNVFLADVGRRRTVPIDVAEQVWEAAAEHDTERQQALRDCLQLLTGRSQQALRMAYGERRSWSQIAAVLDMQASGVKTLLRRCRETLRECIERGTRSQEEAR